MVDRRAFIALSSACTAQVMFGSRARAVVSSRPAKRRLLLVHGRDQHGIAPSDLKNRWITALRRGASALGKALPDELDVSFPYYADVLDKYTRAIPLTSEIQARGDNQADAQFLEFEASVADQLRRGAGISEERVDEMYGGTSLQRSPDNWRWVQAIIRAVDRYGFGMSGNTIEAFMRDVYLYVNHAGVRNQVDHIVNALLAEEPTVIVGHSLGSIVAYNILRSDKRALHVPLFVTVGCPLAIRAIRDQLVPLSFPKPAVETWNNAFDMRDVVALYPLDEANFPVSPAVTNYSRVKNHTNNRHGIDGYLDDPIVADWILNALN